MNIPMLQTSSPIEMSFQTSHQTGKAEPPRLMFPRPRQREHAAEVIFSPLAWLKFLLFLHAGDTEVGGFCISGEKQPLYIEDFVTVKQTVTSVTVSFDDTAVADYFDDCIDRGLAPARFARIWAHTHPGESPHPSSVDEQTFQRVFGDCDWAVMLIVGRTHQTFARLSFNAGPGGSVLLPVKVDWAVWPQILLDQGAQLSEIFERWMDEYGTNIREAPISTHFESPMNYPSGRVAWADRPFREDNIYSHQAQMELDDEFARYYEAAGMEER